MSTLGSMLRAIGDTKTPMKIGIITNVLNVVVDYVLIFGVGPIPALGVMGTALGTLIARSLGTILLYRKVQHSVIAFPLFTRLNKSSFNELLRISFPAALERLVMRLGQVLYFWSDRGDWCQNLFSTHHCWQY